MRSHAAGRRSPASVAAAASEWHSSAVKPSWGRFTAHSSEASVSSRAVTAPGNHVMTETVIAMPPRVQDGTSGAATREARTPSSASNHPTGSGSASYPPHRATRTMITSPIATDWSGFMAPPYESARVGDGRAPVAPVTSQALPRARWPRTASRAPMKTTVKTTQMLTRPPPARRAPARAARRRPADQPARGQVATVAGADQHPVEDEDDAGHRLAERGDEEHRHEQRVHVGVAVNSGPSNGLAAASSSAGHHAADHPPPDHPPGGGPGARDVTGAEGAPGDRLRGDRDRVEDEGQERPQRHRQLVGGQVQLLLAAGGGAEGDGVRRDQQRGPQGEGADHQGHRGPGGHPDPGEVGAQRGLLAPGGADDHGERARRRWPPGPAPSRSRSRRCRGRAGPTPKTSTTLRTMLSPLPATATTSGVRVSWRPRRTPVAASITSSGTVPRKAIRRYVVAWPATSGPTPKAATSGPVSATPATVTTAPMPTASQTPVDTLGQGAAQVTGAEPAGHAGGGAVGEEDAEPDRGLQDDRGDPEPGQLGGAQPADDGGVGEQEQGLGDEGEEGRDREPEDLAVVGAADGGHPSPGKGQRWLTRYATSLSPPADDGG